MRAAAHVTIWGGVIVDATFRRRADRAAFRTGFADTAPVRYAECLAPLAILLSRATTRDKAAGGISDATAEVVARAHSRWQPLDEVPAGLHLVIATS